MSLGSYVGAVHEPLVQHYYIARFIDPLSHCYSDTGNLDPCARVRSSEGAMGEVASVEGVGDPSHQSKIQYFNYKHLLHGPLRQRILSHGPLLQGVLRGAGHISPRSYFSGGYTLERNWGVYPTYLNSWASFTTTLPLFQ